MPHLRGLEFTFATTARSKDTEPALSCFAENCTGLEVLRLSGMKQSPTSIVNTAQYPLIIGGMSNLKRLYAEALLWTNEDVLTIARGCTLLQDVRVYGAELQSIACVPSKITGDAVPDLLVFC